MQRPPRWPRSPEIAAAPKQSPQPHSPEFKPLGELQVGEPFNPYRVFVYGEVLREVLRFGALNDGQKNLWILLADQCQRRGTSLKSQGRLAAMLGWNPRKLRRNIRVLKKLKLVHVEWNLGEPARTWLLYHPLFALCSPLGTDTSVLPLGQNVSPDRVKTVPNMDLPHGSIHGRGDTTFNVGTSNRGTSEARAEEMAKRQTKKNHDAALPITNRVETISVSADFKSHWYSLTPREKQIRWENAARAAEHVAHYRQYINEKDRTISGAARHQVQRFLREVRALGFFIPGFDPQEKP